MEYDYEMKFKAGWRINTFPKIEYTDGLDDVYEFGVFGGNSMIELSHIFMNSGISINKFVGFDSFDGIPKELNEQPQAIWDPDESPFFKAFNASLMLGVENPEDAASIVYEFVKTQLVGSVDELILKVGFYNESLTDSLPSELGLGKAALVDIDCDIYSSAKECLHWLFRNSLVDSGTYVAYDDWGGTPGYKDFADGESRAHREISEEFGVEWELVASHTDHVEDSQVVFRLR